MARGRITAGLFAATIGTAWSAGALPSLWAASMAIGPYVLVGVAIVAAARMVAPRGALIGPGTLLGTAALWLLVRYGMLPSVGLGTAAGLVLVLGGFVVALSGGGQRRQQLVSVRRFGAAILDRRFEVVGTSPAKISIVAALSLAVLDLSRAEFPDFATVHIDVTVLGGRVEIVLPRSWNAVPGRIHTRGVSYAGSADLTLPPAPGADLPAKTAVVNVLGLAGAVDLIAHRLRG